MPGDKGKGMGGKKSSGASTTKQKPTKKKR